MRSFEEHIRDFEVDSNTIWAYAPNTRDYKLPEYGFKIHISATIKNAGSIFESVYQILDNNSIQYKVISSIKNLEMLNSGEFGYSQIGKFMTIYPENNDNLIEIIELLYQATLGFQSIDIASDFRYKNSFVIFYRYGEIKMPVDESKDKRLKTIPDNIIVPIDDYYVRRYKQIPQHYIPLMCLRARGKSRIFQGINIKKRIPIIIKEGIMAGDIGYDGVDGANYIMQEKKILTAVEDMNYFPKVEEVFYVGRSYYMVEEYLQGKTLLELIKSGNSLILQQSKHCILEQLWEILVDLKQRDIIPGDISLDNIILCDDMTIKLIDTEYYCFKSKVSDFKFIPGTPGFWCEEYKGEKAVLYSFVSLWYYLTNPEEYEKICILFNQDKKFICDIRKYISLHDNIKELFDIQNYTNALNYLKRMLIETDYGEACRKILLEIKEML